MIVVTDRTVLDAQLQDTIYQFEHTDSVVGRINDQEGDGSKSEKLAKALEASQPIIIVTIQTFSFVLQAIENSKKAKVKLNQWVRLHDYNISQKVSIIVEHFKDNIMGLLGGQAKAMVVTSSRKEAARYKIEFDKYIAEKGYQKIAAMVAFSGEVEFNDEDPNAALLVGEKYTEVNMNPG